jgi:hypothetical protein
MEAGEGYLLGLFCGVLACIILAFIFVMPLTKRSLSVEVLKTQKQECLSLMGFNGQPLVLCPDECATLGKLELCNRGKGEKE